MSDHDAKKATPEGQRQWQATFDDNVRTLRAAGMFDTKPERYGAVSVLRSFADYGERELGCDVTAARKVIEELDRDMPAPPPGQPAM